MTSFLLIFLFMTNLRTTVASELCHYQSWIWDTKRKQAIQHEKISKKRSELTREELGQVPGCSVCEEDQVNITTQSHQSLKVCRLFAEQIKQALNQSVAKGFPIKSLVGYRVGKSRGKIDAQGWRTEFSNHSYGTAIDVNAEMNGLYDQCLSFNSNCRLLRGGLYQTQLAGAITKDSPLYLEMLRIGFKWGGEIEGGQKDFMHFSLDGY